MCRAFCLSFSWNVVFIIEQSTFWLKQQKWTSLFHFLTLCLGHTRCGPVCRLGLPLMVINNGDFVISLTLFETKGKRNWDGERTQRSPALHLTMFFTSVKPSLSLETLLECQENEQNELKPYFSEEPPEELEMNLSLKIAGCNLRCSENYLATWWINLYSHHRNCFLFGIP